MPFTNSMEDGNQPDTSALPDDFKIPEQKQDTPSSTPWAGDDERPIQDNGTGGDHLGYVMGSPSGNSFPPVEGDSHNDTDEATNILDYGLRESVEVGHDSGISNYGIVGPSAGGGIQKNIIK